MSFIKKLRDIFPLNSFFKMICFILFIFSLMFFNCTCRNTPIYDYIDPNCSYDYPHITQRDITWYFDQEYTKGQFANGDWWVVGPVTILAICPRSVNYYGRIINGSMINPVVDSDHGFDSTALDGDYAHNLNVCYGISPQNPLIVNPGSSLISTISLVPSASHTRLKSGEILTVLSTVPPVGSFRPAYAGSTKTLYNVSALTSNLVRLESLTPPVSSTPELSVVERYFERPWIDFRTVWSGEFIHPSDNMPAYGREFADIIGIGALMLHLDEFEIGSKEILLRRYVQVGIDLYEIMKNGNGWIGEGGFGAGRKWPIIFAGLMLDDSDMLAIGNYSGDYAYNGDPKIADFKNPFPNSGPTRYIHFGEDDQTFYVTTYDVTRTHDPLWAPDNRYGYGTEPYGAVNIGMPEWGIRHVSYPYHDNLIWRATYRQCCTAIAWQGSVLSALIMGAKTLWNHDVLFDYMDRYMAIANGDPDPLAVLFGYTNPDDLEAGWRAWTNFSEDMWDEYRDNY